MARPTVTFGSLAIVTALLVVFTFVKQNRHSEDWFERNSKANDITLRGTSSSSLYGEDLETMKSEILNAVEDLSKRIDALESRVAKLDGKAEDKPKTSYSITPSPQKPQTRRMVQFLTRMTRRGVDFMDKWRPIKYQFSEEEVKRMHAAFGTDDPTFDPKTCTVQGENSRMPVATRLAYHGLGMNLLQLANYIIWAAHHDKFITFIRTSEYDEKNGGLQAHGFQNFYERKFTLALKEDSVCTIYGSICAPLRGHCYDGYWNNTHPNPKMDLWKQATYFMGGYRTNHPDLHDAYKTQLIRETLRMTLEARKTLDEKYRDALRPVLDPHRSSNIFKLSIHIRRTDKITGEAIQLGCEVFGVAAENILREKLNALSSYKSILIHVISDDTNIEQEWNDRVLPMSWFEEQKGRIKYNFRTMKERPDRTSSMSNVERGFWDLLIDMRVMIESDAFLGSQSSNLGVVVCYLRVHENCFNAESASLDWNARESKIAR